MTPSAKVKLDVKIKFAWSLIDENRDKWWYRETLIGILESIVSDCERILEREG